jgi:ParB-like chromosome segregation protein Spo0J
LPKNTPWPADQVERRPVASLIAYARNSRTHSPAQVDQIAASVREWGWTTPVLVAEDNTILAGHGRVLAAQKLGLKEVPVMVARGWSEAQRRAYVIADNQLSLNAGWNEDLLRIELADLQASDFNLSLTGFAPGQLADFIGGKDVEPSAVFDGPAATASRHTEAAEEGVSSATEIDPDAYEMGCKCPRCGFEFDPK